jgi:hypothetical protein
VAKPTLFDDWERAPEGYFVRPDGMCLGDRYAEQDATKVWVGSDPTRPRAWLWYDAEAAAAWVRDARNPERGCSLWGRERANAARGAGG